MQLAARYLGGRQTWNNNRRVEIQYRLRAMTTNWIFMRKCWTSGAPRRQKRLITGLDALPVMTRETLALDGKMGRWLRVLMKGGAVQRADEGLEEAHDDVAMSTKQVMACWGLPPTVVEFAARRIRWLQLAVADPEPHRHWVAVVWGQARFEGEPELGAGGRLCEGAHGIALRLRADLELLAEYDAAPRFMEMWRESEESWPALFDGEMKEEFFRVDVRLLRAAAVHPAHQSRHDSDVAGSDVEKRVECGLLRADGQR